MRSELPDQVDDVNGSLPGDSERVRVGSVRLAAPPADSSSGSEVQGRMGGRGGTPPESTDGVCAGARPSA